MRKVGRYAAALVVGALVFSGCTSEDDAPEADETSSTSESPGPTDPTSAATDEPPEEPELPTEATEQSEAGAEAFARHYVELINYAQSTGEIDPLVQATSADCTGCSGLFDAALEGNADGAHIEGGEMTVSDVYPVPVDYGADYGFGMVIDIEEQRRVAADGTVVVADPLEWNIGLYPLWVDDQWATLWIATPDLNQ